MSKLTDAIVTVNLLPLNYSLQPEEEKAIDKTVRAAIAYNAEQIPDNPLTQEELQNMNNERVWDDYNQGYALVWVHSNHKVTLTFKDGGTAGAEVGPVRKIYREKPAIK
jgi:hypothetical protein